MRTMSTVLHYLRFFSQRWRLWPLQQISYPHSMLSKTGKPLSFCSFFHTGTKAVEQWSEITADVQAVLFPHTIIMHAQANKSSFEDKPHYLNIYINTQYVKMTKIKDQVFASFEKYIYDTPIASMIRVYAACVSLSRPTTVRTIPSLKPTLNLPS